MFSYRSHFGEINEPFLCVSRYALLNNWQVCQVHAEVGNAGRVTSTRSMFNKLLFSEFVFCKKKICTWEKDVVLVPWPGYFLFKVSYLCRASLMFLNLPLEDTKSWSFSIVCLVFKKNQFTYQICWNNTYFRNNN